MNQQPIYLDNLELALEMQKAGFDRDCVHSFQDVSCNTKITHAICAYERMLETFCFPQNSVPEFVFLPTLGEIKLPYNLVIEQGIDGSFLAIKYSPTVIIGKFKTELEARAHAWLWAKQNEKEAKND